MASRLIQEQDIVVTSKEAEAVLELWAKRQSENKGTTVRDLAEAMSVPTEEVAAMLSEVRGEPILPPIAPAELVRRKRNRVLMLAVGGVWIVFVVLVLAHFLARTPTVTSPQPYEAVPVAKVDDSARAPNPPSMNMAPSPSAVGGEQAANAR